MEVIGLTGGIATGKSTVSRIFKEQGISIIDADVIARELVVPGSVALQQIAEHFGSEYVTDEGQLNRKALGRLVFGDAQKLTELNGIMSPLLRQAIKAQIEQSAAQATQFVVLDAATLFEAHFEDLADDIMVVNIPEAVQLNRLMARDGSSEQEASNRITSQLPLAEKVARATVVIDNSGTVAETKAQVLKWLESKGFQVIKK
ncbi:dephospho-CoA kinase [Secundilactobacillus oryzae JCM 18671]|uniref:Dephospho-CoA kinase n=1 Tax=Secundilactobacillus oryzae JCM 18671 TaxID=1291743 RepID=A0A081BG32_9LACO|nr:dephospho-CoA kinase [Secundilactobacillus oryzae]GAK47000.1 dephospho-CoA kinase [Secundilactobacillus oryzae JCM 18671]